MEKNNLIEKLKKTNIFKGFETNQIQKIVSLCQEKNLKSNETLFVQGSASDAIYFLISGQLKVCTNDTLISTVHDGGVVGEIGTITNTARSASVIATHDSEMLFIKQNDLDSLIANDLALGVKLYKNTVEILSKYLIDNNLALEFCKMLS